MANDNNVILEELTGDIAGVRPSEPAPSEESDIERNLRASQESAFRAIINELTQIRDAIVDPAQRAAVDSLINSLQTQFRNGSPLNMVGAIAEARTQAGTALTLSNEAVAQAQFYDSVSALNRYYPNLSAADRTIAVNQLSAIANNNINAFMQATESDLTRQLHGTEIGRQNDAYMAAENASPETQASFAVIQNAPPEVRAQVIAEPLQRRANIEEALRNARTDEERAALRRILPLYMMPESERALERIRNHDGNPSEIADELSREFATRAASRFPRYRQHNEAFANIIDGALPAGATDQQRMDFIVRTAGEATSEDLEAARAAWADSGFTAAGLNQLPARQQQIIAAVMARDTIGQYVALDRMAERAIEIQQFRSLTPEQAAARYSAQQIEDFQRGIQNFERLNDRTVSIEERAALMGTLVGQVAADANLSPNVARARAAFSIAFADANGGMARFSLMMSEASRNTPEGRAYRQAYNDYLDAHLFQGGITGGDEKTNAFRRTQALETLGAQMATADLTVQYNAAGEIEFIRRDGFNWSVSSAAFENSNNVLSDSINYQRLNRQTLRGMVDASRAESRANGGPDVGDISLEDDRAMASILIQAYGLYNSAEGEQIIARLSIPNVSETELRTIRDRVTELGLQRQEQMTEFAPTILESIQQANPERIEILRNAGMINEDGTLNVDNVMLGSARSEILYLNNPVDLRNLTDEQMRQYDREHPPAEGSLSFYEARVYRQAAQQLLGVTALQAVREMGTRVYEALANPSTGAYNEQMQLDDILYSTIVDTEHFSDTDRRAALREVLARDSYLGDPTRTELLDRTTDAVMIYLREHPDYLTQESSRQFSSPSSAQTGTGQPMVGTNNQPAPPPVTATPVAVPATTSEAAPPPMDQLAVPTPPLTQTPSPVVAQPTNTQIDAREAEGNTGAFDQLHRTDLEKAILAAVQNISPEMRLQMLGNNATVQQVQAATRNGTDFLSYNEIEKAVMQMRDAQGNAIRRPDQIADVNGNGFDIVDLQAVLVQSPPATPTVVAAATAQGTGNGR